jgi:hypothetical protein
MSELGDQLSKLRAESEDVRTVLDAYDALDRVYRRSLEAMGKVPTYKQSSSSSANVTLSLDAKAILSTTQVPKD